MDPLAQQPQPNTTPINNTPVQHKKIGPIIGILVIVIILIVAALYLFGSKVNNIESVSNNSQSVQPITNNSDDVSSLQADLDASTDGLDNQNF